MPGQGLRTVPPEGRQRRRRVRRRRTVLTRYSLWSWPCGQVPYGAIRSYLSPSVPQASLALPLPSGPDRPPRTRAAWERWVSATPCTLYSHYIPFILQFSPQVTYSSVPVPVRRLTVAAISHVAGRSVDSRISARWVNERKRTSSSWAQLHRKPREALSSRTSGPQPTTNWPSLLSSLRPLPLSLIPPLYDRRRAGFVHWLGPPRPRLCASSSTAAAASVAA